jgi:Cu(I)/Ag(I) efflux system membrane fusion protein
MKTRPIVFSLFLAASAFVFTGCGKHGSESHEHDHASAEAAESTASESAAADAGAPQFAVDAAFQQQLAGVFKAYVSLKDAFVSSDAAKVKTEAENTQKALAAADMKLLTGAAHTDWMAYLGNMESYLKEITSASDIEAQRKAFSSLSDGFYKSIKAYGLGGSTAYYEYCPMAFDNEGAYWISDAEQIRNPYFGDKMLTCGQVKETLK